MDKRYQVFISSTYADLKDERRAVIQPVIEMNCIPAGMEMFPATDEEQFTFIKRVIDDCDYYLLILAGRYGSVGADGVSYTEKEFDYAVSKGLHVIALVHEDPDQIAHGKSEKDPALAVLLKQFRKKVCTGRVIKHWKSADQLAGFVAQSLSNAMHQFPAVGWVRANKVANEEILAEINNLRKENDALLEAVEELKPIPAVEDLAGLDEQVIVPGQYYLGGQNRDWSAKTTWKEIFGFIAPYLIEHPHDDTVQRVLKNALAQKYGSEAVKINKYTSIDEQTFKTVGVQLKALGLVDINYAQTTNGSMGLFWTATPAGERLMLQLRTVKSAAAPSSGSLLDILAGEANSPA